MPYSPDEQDGAKIETDVEQNWPATDVFPDNPTVALAFHGLIGFSYNPLGFCEVAMHAKAPSHEFSISVYDITTPSQDMLLFTYKVGQASNTPVDVIRLDVVNPAYQGVQFYKPGITSTANQQDSLDEHAFSAVLDLEGPDFYNRPLKKKSGSFKPRIYVKHGIFYTLLRTRFSFKRSSPNDDLPLGRIAWLVGTNIYLQENGFVSLRIGPEEVRLKAAGGKKYLVVFNNGCSPGECEYTPKSPKKEKRNDFYLYYHTFDIPGDQEEYELFLDDGAPVSPEAAAAYAQFEQKFRHILGPLAEILSNDEAPCGGVGYGRSGGLGG